MLDLFPSREASRFGRRRKHARGAKLPVIVVTGFLGAGKTTLLRRFLGSPAGEGTLLGNGCLCCNMRSDLQNALHNLLAERAQGTVPQFKRVLIETSGLADP